MDFRDLMNIASSNQLNAVSKVKSKKAKDVSNQVSSAAVKALLARQNAEKAKQKEREEAARRARIQARLEGKQLGKSKDKKKAEDVANQRVDQRTKNSVKNHDSLRLPGTSKNQAETKRTDDKRKSTKFNEQEKVKKKAEDKGIKIDAKKAVPKSKRPAQPALSFQELLNVAKQQAENPVAFRSNQVVPESKAKSKKTVGEKSLEIDRSMSNRQKKETKTPPKDSATSANNNRKPNKTSQCKQNPEMLKKKILEAHSGSRSEIRERKFAGDHERKMLESRDRKLSGRPDLKNRVSTKPKPMTIERETISQCEYELPMNHRGSKEISNFHRKRRHDMYNDEDEYDEEMDEFIDDSEEAPETISNYIKDIFGYDKSKFRDRDDDIRNMESSFADIQKEEAKSLRIARLEDEVEKLKESYELQQQRQKKKKKLKH